MVKRTKIQTETLPTPDLPLARRAGLAITGSKAGVAELVDAHDSKSCSARSVGSIPTTRTSHVAIECSIPPQSNLVGPASRLFGELGGFAGW